ncbi:hypothetical protein [Mycobacteroides chelonae]|uniref:hypothetical protein n=1 Tax=Mycobacteroides chelonae TaxID=1774 RepID=UPI0008A9AE52|nr:hypothetical protein [Mycobacteroides chelonae]OHT54095.1 hypothetical protein BKG63_07420 [Mycobacteroides chelonae]OHT99868.1 hypothetical protein BKG72_05735 [Mycobacteroides chelonae]OLT86554.1 hypothetical protein BKG59_22400 [Mycobacteroides chelonae]
MTLGELTTHTAALPVQFEAPAENPSPQGLYAATNWTESAGPSRFLISGVDIRVHNFGGDAAFGVWDAGWCVDPDDLTVDDLKDGVRPVNPATFDPITIWSFDECDLTAPSQAEVRARVQQNLRLREQVAVEREVSARLLTDSPDLTNTANFAWAIGQLEAELAKAGVLGLIHLGAQWAAVAAQSQLIRWNGAKLTSPLGHQYVFGGGYVEGLGNTLVATSQTYGWRDGPTVRDTTKVEHNRYVAVAERSLVVGYESAVASIEISA